MFFNKKSVISLLIAVMMVFPILPAMATETEETLYMFQGDTYSFVNATQDTCIIYPCNHYDALYDYIHYDADGDIYSTGFSTSSYSIYLYEGESLVISAKGVCMDVVYPKGSIEVKKEDTECFENKILVSENTCSLKNVSDKEMPIYVSTGFSDVTVPYVLYDEEGRIAEYEFAQAWGYRGKSVPVGYTIKIQTPMACDAMKLCYILDSFTFEMQTDPVYDETTILSGESFSFKNISEKSLTLFADGGERDWRLYDENGNMTEEGLKTVWGSGGNVEKEIPAGYTLELSLTHTIDVNTLHGKFSIEKADDAKATRVYVLAGDTCSFTNKSNRICKLVTDSNIADLYNDYIIINRDGNLISQVRKAKWSSIFLNPGETIKLTPRCRSMEIALYEDEFEFKKESTPVFSRNIIRYGEKYSFENISSSNQKILGDLYGSYEIHDADGNIVESADGVALDGLVISAGHTLYVTGGATAECVVLREAFVSQKVSDPEDTDYLDLCYGKTYKITNNSTSRYTFKSDDNDITHDYISYYKNGSEYSSGCGTSYDFTIYDGGYAYVTLYANMSIYNSPSITVEEVETSVYEKADLVPGKIYSFENLTDDDSVYAAFSSISDSIEYDREGNLINFSCKSYGAYVSGKIIAKINAYYSTACYLSEKIKFSQESQISLGVAEFSRGESARVISTLTNSQWLTAEGGKLLYAVYGSDGAVQSISLDEHYFSTLIMDPGEYAEFTATGRNRIIYPTEYVNFEKLDKTPFEYKKFSVGDTVLIKADSSKDVAFRIMTGNYDYVKYDKNNQITEYAMDVNCSDLYSDNYNEQIILYAGESMAITLNNTEMILMTAGGGVTVQNRDYPALGKKVIAPKEKYAFTNPYENSVKLLYNAYEFDYVLYDESYNIKKSSSSTYTGKLEIKPQYRIEITNSDYPAMIAFPYEMQNIEDSTVKVTGISVSMDYLTLGLYESKTLTASIFPDNATYKGVTWSSSDTSVATVSSNGTVKGIKAGSATITATTKDGGFTASCEVTVTDLSAKGIALSESFAVMKVGEKKTLEATVLPLFASDRNVTWSSSSSYLASVSSTGEVEALSTGYVEIYAKTSDGKYTATCTIVICPDDRDTDNVITIGTANTNPGDIVQIPVKISGNADVESISMPMYYDNNTLTLKAIEIGDSSFMPLFDTKNLKAYPFWIEFFKEKQPLTDGEEYTLVTLTFAVSADAKTGDYPITVFSNEYGITDCDFNDIAYNVTVGGIKVEEEGKSISLDKSKLNLSEGQSVALSASILNGDGSEKLIWGSSDYSVVSVSNGTIRAIAPGTATVTVTTDDYEVYASCTVVVAETREPSIGDISVIKDGSKAKISLEAKNIPQSAWVFVATYTDNNKMLSIETLEIDENGLYGAEVSLGDVGMVKVFAYESMFGIKPLCPAKSRVDITE